MPADNGLVRAEGSVVLCLLTSTPSRLAESLQSMEMKKYILLRRKIIGESLLNRHYLRQEISACIAIISHGPKFVVCILLCVQKRFLVEFQLISKIWLSQCVVIQTVEN